MWMMSCSCLAGPRKCSRCSVERPTKSIRGGSARTCVPRNSRSATGSGSERQTGRICSAVSATSGSNEMIRSKLAGSTARRSSSRRSRSGWTSSPRARDRLGQEPDRERSEVREDAVREDLRPEDEHDVADRAHARRRASARRRRRRGTRRRSARRRPHAPASSTRRSTSTARRTRAAAAARRRRRTGTPTEDRCSLRRRGRRTRHRPLRFISCGRRAHDQLGRAHQPRRRSLDRHRARRPLRLRRAAAVRRRPVDRRRPAAPATRRA